MRTFLISTLVLGLSLNLVSCEDKKTTSETADIDTLSRTDTIAPPLTSIEFVEAVHEFGDLKEGVVAKHTFEFKNTGDKPLVIRNAKASCGCTTPEYPKSPIAPGETGKLVAAYNSDGRPGEFTKTISVEANTSPDITVLTIKGKVIPKPQVIEGPFKK